MRTKRPPSLSPKPKQTRNRYRPQSFKHAQKVDVKFSEWFTISAAIQNKQVHCLVDTGASINLIDHDWLINNLPTGSYTVESSRISSARAANGSDMQISGFVTLSLTIDGSNFVTPFNVAPNLSESVILGSKFLKKHGAVINCGTNTLSLNTKSQLRVIKKQEIPPHSQSVLCAKISNQLPANTMGLCQGGRRMNALGVLIANTISSVSDNCAHLLVMNYTDDPITLYPRTKLGTFSLVPPKLVNSFSSVPCERVNNVKVSEGDSGSQTKQFVPKETKLLIDEVLSKVKLNAKHLSSTEMSEIKALIAEYIDIFQIEGGPLGYYSRVKHSVHPNSSPIRSRPYRLAPHVQAEVRKQVGKMLDQGVIRESTSPWSFPVCMIPKAGTNTWRFCIDFRKLNDVVPRQNWPLPHIDDALDSLGSSNPEYFSTLDLASGYWQIGLEESSKSKTAFITQDGLFEFNVMPFGLHNAPATFQRAIQEIMRGLNWKFVFCYLDDVIIFSRSFEEHVDHLRQVFDRLRQAGLKLQPKKCTFGQTEVKYLGHIVSKDGVATDPDKIKLVKDYPIPTKVSEIKSFMGFVGYYRRYIKDFCKIADPLTNLTRKKVPFVWDEKCNRAFETLKEKLMEPPILAYPRFDGTEFILQTDASYTGLGYILAQVQDGKEKVISYGGRSLKNPERNYSTTELEALAVVEGIKKYTPYLQHTVNFKVITDHCALKWLFSKKPSGGRLARWALKLQSYKFTVVHIPGRNNSNADALSRINFDDINKCTNCSHHSPSIDSKLAWEASEIDDILDDALHDQEIDRSPPTVNAVRNLRYKPGKRAKMNDETASQKAPSLPSEIDLDKFKESLLTDKFASTMLAYLDHETLPENVTLARDIVLQSDQYFSLNGLLYHIWHTPAKRHMPERNVVRLYVPVTFIDTVLNNCHDHVLAAHFGFQRTYDRIRQRYFWKGMYRDIDNWVRSCISCSQRKTHRHKVIAPLVNMKVPGAFERVSVDVLGPLPTTVSGCRYVLCFTDHCTRWPILVPMKAIDASSIARVFFDYVICEHGCPNTLLSDRGTNFLSKVVLEVCRIMRTQKLNTSSYHPECNAIQERYNAVILDTISHYVNQFHSDWDTYLSPIQFAYRTTPATNSVGFSPFFLLYGREARLPIDVTLLKECHYPDKTLREHIHVLVSQLEVFRAVSKSHAETNQANMKERYDERSQEVQYQVGDTVWIYIPALQKGLSRKLMKFWSGPYLLIEKTGPVNFRVRNLENNKLLKAPIHVNRMKYAYDRYVRPSNNDLPEDQDHEK